jgi:hypothetical protein
MRAICVDSESLASFRLPVHLTAGKAYEVFMSTDNAMVMVVDDQGRRGAWRKDRFVPDDGSVLAMGERKA